jgi:hypothetical protein
MTRYPRPEPITRATTDRLDQAVAAVVGRGLIRVDYRSGVCSNWPEGYARGQVDEVDQAILLSFNGGPELIISWVTPGLVEGVDIEVGEAGSFPVPEGLQVETVVSGEGPWSDICGTPLEGVSAAWDVAGQLAAETVWAVRLTFAGIRRVVIALGIIEGGTLRYHPQGLVVLFDEGGLRSYRDPMISQTSRLWQPVGAKLR